MEKGKIIPKEQSHHLKKWALTSFDAQPAEMALPEKTQPIQKPTSAPQESPESAAISVASLALPTAEELEHLHESAFKEGHDAGFAAGLSEGREKGLKQGQEQGEQIGQKKGFEQGFESGKAEGFALGKEEGLKEAKAESQAQLDEEKAEQISALKTLLTQFHQSLASLKQNIAEEVLNLSVAMAQKILHKELTLPQSHLNAILQESLAHLPNASSKIVVRLNPQDLVFLNPQDFPPKIFDFIEDKNIQKGGCQIDLDESSLDARIEERWSKSVGSLGLSTPWEEQPVVPNVKAVVSQNPALSSFLEKNLVQQNENKQASHTTAEAENHSFNLELSDSQEP